MKLEPEKYPIDRQLPAMAEALNQNSCLLVKAETGAGKTTRLPPYFLEKTPGKILVLEPRRLAAKLSAARCAQILNEDIGATVGHHIRFDKTATEKTRLLFITEGLFLPYLRQGPDLKEFSVVVIDEFHERNIHTDIALALTKRLIQTTRPDLKLVVMSATLETEKLESYLGGPKVFDVLGRTFPVHTEYRPPEIQGQGRRRGQERWDDAAARAVEEIVADARNPLNTLVFLPGMGEIKALEQKLKDRVPNHIEIVPLHSSLPKEIQNKAFKGENRKVILSTNIAETSLTIPNVTGVVDLGSERRASFAPWSGMPLLQLEKISKASAVQRGGRAGRTREGVVFRVYSEADLGQREAFTPPEIKRVELSHHLLDLLELGIHPDQLDWFEPPEERHLATALELLEFLGALRAGKLTDTGRYLARTPLHPRMGAILYHCSDEEMSDALLAACILSEGMVLNKGAEFFEQDEGDCDLSLQMDLIKAWVWKDKNLSDYDLSYLDFKKAKRVVDLYQALASQAKAKSKPKRTKTKTEKLTPALLKGFPDRVAARRSLKSNSPKRSKSAQSYNLCLGRGGNLSYKSVLSQSSPEFLLVLDALEDPKANAAVGTTIQAASKLPKDLLLEPTSPFYSQEKETSFNEKKGLLSVVANKKYGKLTIASESADPVVAQGEALAGLMNKNWPWPFKSDSVLRDHNRRVKHLNQAEVENQCPVFEGEMFELFLESCVDEKTSYQDLLDTGLQELVRRQLSPQDEYILEKEAPVEVELENKKKFAVSYGPDGPCIEARVQDLYSVKNHPSIAAGKIPLTIKLLSPANRVAQVVQDLPGFWKTSWPEVKKELKARYPKHYWPQDPEHAPPIRVRPKN